MASSPLILFPPDQSAAEPWRLGRSVDGRPRVEPLPVADDAAPSTVAAAIVAVGRGPVTIALPSSTCLSATVATDGRFRGGWRNAMVYSLEQSLPLAAEDVAADFLPHPRQPSALGIAVAIAAVRPWVDALESTGLTVAAICPAALLAVDLLRPADGVVAWGHGSAVDLVSIVGGQVTAWFTMPAEPDDVRLYLPAVSAAGAAQLLDVPDAVAELIPGTRRSEDWATAATTAVLSRRRPRVDLARDGLAPRGRAAAARRSLVHATIAAAACVACACAAMLWRASGYQSLADAELDRQRQVFHDLYPARTAPADVRSRLGSEARALASPTADAGGSSALVVLHDVLAHLPPDARFQLTDLRVADGSIHVEGTVPTRSDADAVAAAVRAGTGLSIDTPQTNQSGPQAVHFVLSGSTGADRGGL